LWQIAPVGDQVDPGKRLDIDLDHLPADRQPASHEAFALRTVEDRGSRRDVQLQQLGERFRVRNCSLRTSASSLCRAVIAEQFLKQVHADLVRRRAQDLNSIVEGRLAAPETTSPPL
jgi:hypothetical protein